MRCYRVLLGCLRSRLLWASILTVLAACGGSYGESADASAPSSDGGASDDASGIDASAIMDANRSDDAGVAPDAEAGSDAASGVGVAEVSAACIRVDPSLRRLPRTHVVSVYEGKGSIPTTKVSVVEKDVTLVLASYDALTWQISVSDAGSLERVYVEAFNENVSSVVVKGVPADVPITKRGASNTSHGYTHAVNVSGGGFKAQMASIRTWIDGLETTYQGAYTGDKFTVGGPLPLSGAEVYDTRDECRDPCSRTGAVTAWKSVSGGMVTITGLAATSNDFAELRVQNGARCGKHYFELETTSGAKLGISSAEDYYSVGADDGALLVPPSARVGVAVDLDARTVVYTTKFGDGTTVKEPPKPLDLWYRGAVGPAVSLLGQAEVQLILRAPFVLPVPDGYATDL